MILTQIMGINFDMQLFIYISIAAVVVFVILNRDLLKKRHALLISLRCGAIACLFLVLAGPHIIREEMIMEEGGSIILLADKTGSMSLYRNTLQNLVGPLTGRSEGLANVELREIASREYTALGDELYQAILGSSLKSSVVIVESDGNSNKGTNPLDIAAYASKANTRIFAILPEPIENEVFIESISGAKNTPINSEYIGSVRIGKLGEDAAYKLKLSIGSQVLMETDVTQEASYLDFPFRHVFSRTGPYNISASIVPASDDFFVENNAFNKVVDVTERPRILLVTESEYSPLREVLEEVYALETRASLPSVLNTYSAIVIDNIHAGKLGDYAPIREFIAEGSGLLVVGGNSSYGNGGYYGSGFERLLPVRSTEAEEKKDRQINIIFVIDISGSTGLMIGGETKIDLQKSIIVRMIRDLADAAHMGAVTFNSDAYVIQQILKMDDSSPLEEKVSRLKFGGGTYVLVGLTKAREMLRHLQGSRYVILVSDGITNYPVKAFQEAASMAEEGIITHTIGVGFDTDESFMAGLALQGRGSYFSPSQTDRVKLIVGALEEQERDESKGFAMIVTDANHFITQGMWNLNVSLKSFNDVTAKSGSQILAATPSMKPILAIWRFGLGRVVSLSTDSGREWSGQLYGEGNSRIVSSSVNWAVGDAERGGDLRIECADTRVGKETVVIIRSKKEYPRISLGGDSVDLKRLDQESYYFSFVPESAGFLTVGSGEYSCAMAVNYPQEFGELRLNTAILTAMADTTGGEVYQSGQTSKLMDDLSGYVVDQAMGISRSREDLYYIFGLVALILFFSDVAMRRISEMRKKGRK
jgi:uncharacterized membrane protein